MFYFTLNVRTSSVVNRLGHSLDPFEYRASKNKASLLAFKWCLKKENISLDISLCTDVTILPPTILEQTLEREFSRFVSRIDNLSVWGMNVNITTKSFCNSFKI